MYDVRLAAAEDLSDVAALDTIPESRLRMKTERGELLVAVGEDGVVGSLRFGFMWDDSPFIHQIVVAEPVRGRGIGTGMLRYLERTLATAGYGLLLSSSECSEVRAQHWHRRSGFDEVGIIAGLNKGGVGEVFFSKAVEPAPAVAPACAERPPTTIWLPTWGRPRSEPSSERWSHKQY